ncbi:MAG: BlaI/MecI/CopY family transcriptional regulator [Bacillota bacterium]|nr:BlaI/MecI/CopY family transcriptional regulator [Bacillota bacterium]
MADESLEKLSRRERQIMDIILQKGSATVLEVHKELDDKSSYSTIRALMRILEEKGYLRHEAKGVKYVYYPAISKERAEKNAIRNLLSTFFNN